MSRAQFLIETENRTPTIGACWKGEWIMVTAVICQPDDAVRTSSAHKETRFGESNAKVLVVDGDRIFVIAPDSMIFAK
jgi:hypothetical protein